jgi:hypothetical protein
MAVSVLAIVGLEAVELVPLACGVLTRGTSVLAAVLLLAGVAIVVQRRSVSGEGADERPVRPRARPFPTPSTGLGALALLITGAVWLAWMEVAVTAPVQSADALNFHLPGAISFIQSGSLWHVTQYLVGQAQGNYPQNGDILMLAAGLPWHSLAFVRYVDVPLLAIAGLAVYATARELRAPTGPAALAALALLAIRPVVEPALADVMTDPCFLAGFAIGMLFLVRHGRTQARGDLVLAGLGLGIAFGTKWYGLTDVPALVIVWAILAWQRGGHVTPVLKDLGVVVACILVGGGVWLLRNLILTGNPVFDYRLSVFGLTILPAPPDQLRARIGFSLAHYAGHLDVLRHYVWPVFRQDFGLTGLLLVLGALIAPVLRGRSRHRLGMLAGGALLCALAYAVTPYSAQGFAGAPTLVAVNTRYGAPALVLTAPLLAVVIGRLRCLRLPLELVLLVLIALNLHHYLWTSAGRVFVNAVALAGLLVLFGLARLLPRWGLVVRPRTIQNALILACGCAVAVAAYHYQRVLAGRPYAPADATIDYVLTHAPTSTRIGVTGIWTAQGVEPVAPMFGPRFGNRLGYVGPFVDHRLEQYTSRARFVAALQRDRYRFLEIGRGIPPVPAPVQMVWARSAGYAPVAQSPRLILMSDSG